MEALEFVLGASVVATAAFFVMKMANEEVRSERWLAVAVVASIAMTIGYAIGSN